MSQRRAARAPRRFGSVMGKKNVAESIQIQIQELISHGVSIRHVAKTLRVVISAIGPGPAAVLSSLRGQGTNCAQGRVDLFGCIHQARREAGIGNPVGCSARHDLALE